MYKFNLIKETTSNKYKVYGWWEVPDDSYFEKYNGHYRLNEKGLKHLNFLIEPNTTYTLYDIVPYNYKNAVNTIKYSVLTKLIDMNEHDANVYLNDTSAYDLRDDIVTNNPELDEDIVTNILKIISESIISYYENKKVDIDELDNMLTSGDFIENTENDFYN